MKFTDTFINKPVWAIVISLIILHWTVVFTVGIAAFIVMMMKGPAYVADAYPLNEAETLDEPPKWKPHWKPHDR